MQDLTANQHYQAALATARTLRDAGHQAFYAGGCVRDLLLGLTPKDFDVATSASPDQVLALFPRTFAVGAHFGVILVCQPGVEDPKDIPIEVATFRHDGSYSDGRRPDAVRFSSSPDDDVHRRDFTINGMLLDPIGFELHRQLHAEAEFKSVISTGGEAEAEKPAFAPALLDLVDGQADLADHLIRAIGDPHLRFAEDKLRMLRAVRFAARLGFTIEPHTARAIQRHADSIAVVSPERIQAELTRILTEGGARRGFELLDTLGLLPHVLPEVARLKGVPQPPEYHPEGDVWTHTLLLLENLTHAPQIPEPTPTTDLSFRPEAQSAVAERPASPTATNARVPHSSAQPMGGVNELPPTTNSVISTEGEAEAEKPASPTATNARVPHSSAQPMGGVDELPPTTNSVISTEGEAEAEKPASPPATNATHQPTPTLAWASLLHDIGKPATYTPPNPAVPNDRIRFNNHVDVGVAIAERILARLRFSNDDTAQILALIKNHMRFGDILHMKQSTLRRFLRLPRFPEHLALHWLDVTAAHNDLRLYDYALANYQAEPPANLRPAPLLTGRDLIAAGYFPSPQFKPMLTLAEDAQLEGTITTPAQALALIHHHFPLPTAAH